VDLKRLLGKLLMYGYEGALHTGPNSLVELGRLFVETEFSARLVVAVLELVKELVCTESEL